MSCHGCSRTSGESIPSRGEQRSGSWKFSALTGESAYRFLSLFRSGACRSLRVGLSCIEMTTLPSKKLTPAQRVRSSDDFKRVYAARLSVRLPEITVAYAPNGLARTRLGLSVSTKNGNAVIRNRIKRVFRAAFRETRGVFPAGLDCVLIPNPKFKDYRAEVIAPVLLLAAQKIVQERSRARK